MPSDKQLDKHMSSNFTFITPRPAKRRARQACVQCRTRKVRCDLVLQTCLSCTNCRLDGVACKITESRRRKNHKMIEKPIFNEEPPALSNLTHGSPTGTENSVNTTLEDDVQRESSRKHGFVGENYVSPKNQSQTLPSTCTSAPHKDRFLSYPCLPHFIKPLPPELGDKDWRYLKDCGCFSFPSPGLEKVALRKYAKYVDPLVPVLGLDEFVGSIQCGGAKKVSLLLYHAVLCAGLAAVDLATIREYGYPSKSAARRTFYSRAKAMFEVEAETDRLILCQAAILFISWASTKHSKDAFYWLGIAISYAYSLGLHTLEPDTARPKDEQLLRHRIWWTLVMREGDVCLCLGRPPRIWPQKLPPLQHEVFLSTSKTTSYASHSEIGRFRRDTWVQHRLQMACIEKAKLALIIYRILWLPRPDPQLPNGSISRQARIWQLDAELKNWRHHLPSHMNSLNPTLNLALNINDESEMSLHLSISVVNLTQHMATIMLHKSEISIADWREDLRDDYDQHEEEAAMDVLTHPKCMRQAASEITTIHKILHDHGLTPAIPTIGVATICAAVFVHLLDAKAGTIELRNAGLKQLDACLEIFQELGQINETAEDVTRLVASAVEVARSAGFSTQNQRLRIPTEVHPGSKKEQIEELLPFTNDSYMEGVIEGQPTSPVPIQSTEFSDVLDFTSQEVFSELENYFDFDLSSISNF